MHCDRYVCCPVQVLRLWPAWCAQTCVEICASQVVHALWQGRSMSAALSAFSKAELWRFPVQPCTPRQHRSVLCVGSNSLYRAACAAGLALHLNTNQTRTQQTCAHTNSCSCTPALTRLASTHPTHHAAHRAASVQLPSLPQPLSPRRHCCCWPGRPASGSLTV